MRLVQCCCCLGALLCTPLAASEALFRAALEYTVDVRTVVEVPFIGDERGTLSAAGFLVDRNRGWLLTNAHVASQSPASVQVAFRDGEFTRAVRSYIDPYLDVAVLQIPPQTIPARARPAALDCGAVPPVGHPVGAFGHPWNLRFTGTRGIVSGRTHVDEVEWLQTDAPLNPGNSGGPLVSLVTGRVVGVNAAILDKSETENLNFAVPITYVCRILELLRQGRDPSPPALHVVFVNHSGSGYQLLVAESYYPQDSGLREGDVVLRVEGAARALRDESDLVDQLRGVDGTRRLIVRRDGHEVIVPVEITPRANVLARTGVQFSRLLIAPAPLRDVRQLRPQTPLMIHSAEPGAVPCTSALGPWQFLKSVDGQRFADVGTLHDYLAQAERSSASVLLLLKQVTDLPDRLWEYVSCALPVENLRIVRVNAGNG